MMAKLLIGGLIAALALASCAGGSEMAPAADAGLPPPQASAPAIAPVPDFGAAPAAQGVQAPPPPAPRNADDADVIVPGVVERQVPPPEGDPRSVQERMADVRAWDTCVMHAQARTSGDPMRPQLDPPEETCRHSLGMASRLAVPDSRRP